MPTSTVKLSILSMGLAIGVTWGVVILLTGLIGGYFDYAQGFVTAMGSIYVGYKATLWGSILGGLYGFIDGFIFGVLIAWFYNLFNGCCGRCCKKTNDSE